MPPAEVLTGGYCYGSWFSHSALRCHNVLCCGQFCIGATERCRRRGGGDRRIGRDRCKFTACSGCAEFLCPKRRAVDGQRLLLRAAACGSIAGAPDISKTSRGCVTQPSVPSVTQQPRVVIRFVFWQQWRLRRPLPQPESHHSEPWPQRPLSHVAGKSAGGDRGNGCFHAAWSGRRTGGATRYRLVSA